MAERKERPEPVNRHTSSKKVLGERGKQSSSSHQLAVGERPVVVLNRLVMLLFTQWEVGAYKALEDSRNCVVS